MSERRWDSMNEAEFDSLLQNSLPELPPGEVVQYVTPCCRALDRILIGLAMNMVTLHFLKLDYILPTVGMILLLLGFRTLRRENGWFRGCWIITLIQAAYFFPMMVLNATILGGAAADLLVSGALTALVLVLQLSQLFCLWKGFKAVRGKAGLEPEADGVVVLMVWYLLVCGLALLQYNGLIIGLVILVAYIFILRGLFRLSEELDEAKYAIQAAPVRAPDRVVVWAIIGTLVAGMACGYLFANSYPMEWRAVEPAGAAEAAGETELAEVRSQLVSLGFPEEVLQDLTPEDIMACEGAVQVVTDTPRDHPVNEGRDEVVQQTGGYTTQGKVYDAMGGTIHTTVYDVKELRLTNVAVELPGEREQWKIFHHFLWIVDPGFYGTEAIQLWPAYRQWEGWEPLGEVSGRVLYTAEDGRDFAAPYYFLGSETYTADSVIWGPRTSTDIFAAFSLPRGGEAKRGYVSYAIEEVRDGTIVYACINYIHQRGWLQYPVMTAMGKRMAGSRTLNERSVFVTVQDAMEFFPYEDRVELY